MAGLQVYYTSCLEGLLGAPGYQVAAASDGVGAAELAEVKRASVYNPPKDVPQHPTSDEIAALYPVAFRFQRLSSGRYALTRTAYLGQDYSGRWGNYFAHTLVLEPADVAGRWPIDLYEWEGWKGELSPGGGSGATLPSVEVADIPSAPSFDPAELADFLAEEEGRVDTLAAMVRAIFASRDDHRPIVVRDARMNGLYWIACLQKTLPPHLAHTLGWSSYQFDPQRAVDVNATSGTTDYRFDTDLRDYTSYLFDAVAEEQSRVAELSGSYADMVSRWMLEAPTRLARFQAFTQHFTGVEFDASLGRLARLFAASEGCAPHSATRDLGDLLAYAQRQGRPESSSELSAVFASAAGHAGDATDAQAYHRLIVYVVASAVRSGRPEGRAQAVELWLSMFDACVLRATGGLEPTRAASRVVQRDLHVSAAEWSRAFFSSKRTEHLLASAGESQAPVDGLAEVCRLRVAAEEPLEGDRVVSAFVKAGLAAEASAERVARTVMSPVPAADLVPVALWLSAETGAPDAVGSAFAGRFDGDALESLEAARAALTRTEPGRAILLGEWLARLSRADSAAHFWDDCGELVLRHAAFADAHGGQVMAAALDAASDEDRRSLQLRWVVGGEWPRLPSAAQRSAVDAVSAGLPIDDSISPEDRRNADATRKAAQDLGVVLRPDRPRLQAWVLALQMERAPELDRGESVRGLPTETYVRFLEAFLEPALRWAGDDPTLHLQVMRAALDPGHTDAFGRAYEETVSGGAKGRWSPLHSGAFRVLVHEAGDSAQLLGQARYDSVRASALRRLALADEPMWSGEEQWLRGQAGPECANLATEIARPRRRLFNRLSRSWLRVRRPRH